LNRWVFSAQIVEDKTQREERKSTGLTINFTNIFHHQ